ncbi:MAG TPA: TonB-dependent receptor [Steroidobacteraceae bacterium]|nr:TonB-dependent receptor [Steroidobacteraceae bacterium]
MSSSNAVRRAVRYALLVSAVAAYAPAHAADEVLDRVVVTGSRITNPNLESPSPVQVIDSTDIDAAGVVNIQQMLLKSPVFGTPGISRTNSNFATASAGVSTVNLRELGEDRTLVLVNGRRFVAGIPGSAAVDLNTIPTQFIERVEVLTGGASAVYGSDAVAGVVNFIYKKNFEGVEFNYQYGQQPHEGDAKTTEFSVTMGTNVADGKGNVMAHLGYVDEGGVFSRDRARSAVDQTSYGAADGIPGHAFWVQTPFFSGTPPQGAFFTDTHTYTYSPTNQVLDGFFANGTATRAPDGFNRSAKRIIAVPTERYLAALQGDYEFADKHSAFLEVTYASSQTISELEPFPLSSANIYPNSGQVPVESRVIVDVGGVPTLQTLVNPLIPAHILADVSDNDADGLRDFAFSRRLSEVGNRGNVADRDTFRYAAGLKGEIFESGWSYEVFNIFGATKEAQTSSGQVNVLNFRNALEAVPDADDIDGDNNTTEAICASPNARAEGCVPINVFGFGSISPAAADYIKAPGSLTTFTSQKITGLNVSGDLFDLPAGAISMAAGAEYRQEFSRSEFDPLQQAGLNAGNAIPRTEGEFDVTEFYGEFHVPLLKDVFMADSLGLSGAVRFSDYSTVGSTRSWNGGMEWSPIPQIKFRAIRAQSTRAPNVNELFSPPSQDFPTGLSDPCEDVTLTSVGASDALCRAAPGVLANINANGGVFTVNQADRQGISGFNLGNPTVEEEIGRSWTLGVVITPDSIPVLEKFTFTIDYFKIDIADAIVSTPRSFILTQCYTANQLCNFITRRPGAVGANSAGSLEFINSGVTNSGGLSTKGVDFTIGYGQNLADIGLAGRLNARLSWTHLLDGYVIPLVGGDTDYFVGEIGGSGFDGTPRNSGFLTLNYSLGAFKATWSTTYIGASGLDDQTLAGTYGLGTRGAIGIGSYMYHDVQVGFEAHEHLEIFAGATNVFDKDPPPIISGVPGDETGTETASSVYDPIGIQAYIGFRAKF